MNWKRLAAACVLALLIAPGTWLRSAVPLGYTDNLQVTRLDVAQPDGWPKGLSLAEAWQLASENPEFGGFSALVAEPGGAFRAFSDRGRTILISRPAEGFASRVPVEWVEPDPSITSVPDIEAAIVDPQTGTLWLAYEHHNAVRRIDSDGTSTITRPVQMKNWGENSGAEAMSRLPDGRFVVLSERLGEGLLFENDPVEGGEVTSFRFEPPGNFRPTAMARMPDGRMLVLLRAIRWQVPPFASMLVVADPANIRAGEPWPYDQLIAFDDAGLRENYEGMTIEPAGDGAVSIWLISDDNLSVLQRTLMLKLRWNYSAHMETAREVETSGPLTSD